MTASSLCLACSSTVSSPSDSSTHITECCGRTICQRCSAAQPRLASYNPCLTCLGGVGVVTSARESNRNTLKVGGVDESNVFVLEDSDEEEESGGGVGSKPAGSPPPYTDINNSPTQTHPGSSGSTPDGLTAQDSSGSSKPELSEKVPTISRNSEYWIKPGDTLVGIALKFGVDGRLLCKMNALPPSTLSITPHLLHTRTTLVLPPTARRPPTPPPADVQERLEARAKEKAAKRLQFVTKELDPTIARAYVSLAEGVDGDNTPNYEDEGKKEKRAEPLGTDVNLQDRAVDRYLADEEWEADQRRQGFLPVISPFPFFEVGLAGGSKEKTRWSWWR